MSMSSGGSWHPYRKLSYALHFIRTGSNTMANPATCFHFNRYHFIIQTTANVNVVPIGGILFGVVGEVCMPIFFYYGLLLTYACRSSSIAGCC